jgi:cyclophilin family peptidyl-prolyl cis-trans isomerase
MRRSRLRRSAVALALLALPLLPARAHQGDTLAVTRQDSLLLYAVLAAEDRRDAADPALAQGAAHPNPRIAHIARRAQARLADSTFAAREQLGRPAADRPIPTWAEPEWAARYRALGGRDGDCAALLAALDDPAAQVRQRAIVLSGQRRSCVGNATLTERLVAVLREGASRPQNRRPPAPSWQLAADAMVALARVAPDVARNSAQRIAANPQPQLRRAAARAATILQDTLLLARLLRDREPNVVEAAIIGTAATRGHRADAAYRELLTRRAPQVQLAAAEALTGTTDSVSRRAAANALRRSIERNWATERDVRNALRAVLGEPATEPWAPGRRDSLPFDVVALALGERRYVQVVHSRLHGGRDFTVELRGDVAPIQAARVLAHVRAGGYDGTRWHRVEPNFVIQGGSPLDNEYSGSGRFVVDELGTVPHPRGSVGMSTRGHATGDLQWFVNLRDNARLTGAYTVFAVVVDQMSVVDDVMEGDQIAVMREVSAPRRGRP